MAPYEGAALDLDGAGRDEGAALGLHGAGRQRRGFPC